MSCSNYNEVSLLTCICDKIFYLHQMIEPLLNNIVTLLTNLNNTTNHISNNTDTIVSQLNDLITCCQNQNNGSVRRPVVISVNPSSTPPNRITDIAGIVPGSTYMDVEFRNVGTNPVLVNGFILLPGQRRVYQVYGGDVLGPISYDCTTATGIALGGTGAGTLEIEGILI